MCFNWSPFADTSSSPSQHPHTGVRARARDPVESCFASKEFGVQKRVRWSNRHRNGPFPELWTFSLHKVVVRSTSALLT